ncbi:hypothetical protein [Streptosporangium sp. V21-05]|uniref:hypothetical protein n=1 Tax=Streptosporangium sp. V21-05 TaxID=3446115 RepID=UPI003F52B9F8
MPATGWKNTGAARTVPPSVAASAMLLVNSKNWVARTTEYGIDEFSISFSWAIFA